MNRIILALLATAVLYAGCKKEKTPECRPYIQQCKRVQLPTAFIGFDSAELANIVVYRYAYDSTFTKEIDRTNFSFTGSYLKSGHEVFYKVQVSDSFDYKIEVPAANTSFYIHSAPIPDKTDTIECPSRGTPYNPPCITFAPVVWVNGKEGLLDQTGPIDVYLMLKK